MFCDNYLDGGYHVGVAHPELAGQLDLGDYSSRLLGTASVQTCAPEGGAGARLQGARQAGYFFVYPNAMVNRYGAAGVWEGLGGRAGAGGPWR